MKKYLLKILLVVLPAMAGADLHAQNSPSLCQVQLKEVALEKGAVKYLSMGSGQPVLLLHGLFAQKEQWSEFGCELSKGGYAVYAPDLPGYGASTGFAIEDYQLDKEVLLIQQFVNAIQLKKFHIAGNSMGGAIAALYSAKYPETVKSLAFIGAPLGIVGWSKQVRSAITQGVNPFIPINTEQLNLEMCLLFFSPPNIPETLQLEMLKPYVANNRHYQQVWDIVNLDINVLTIAQKSYKPTMIIWGEGDGIFNIAGKPLLDKKFPKALSLTIPNASHLIMLEKPSEIAGLYKGFLRIRAP
jgi:abhydrolase domain-containing protein 6